MSRGVLLSTFYNLHEDGAQGWIGVGVMYNCKHAEANVLSKLKATL